MNRKYLVSTLLILLTMLGFLPELFHPVHASTLWGSPTGIVTSTTSNHLLESGLQASNGTMWLAWETNLYRGDSLYDIAYQTYTNGVWSSVSRATNNVNVNISPSITQLSNGTIMLFWANKPAASYLIYYQHFNPNTWSSPSQISSTTLNDTMPSAAVGRDGTLWLAWTRTNSTCVSPCTDVSRQIYYKTLRSGVWSSETKLSTDNAQQNWSPSVMVGKDSVVRVAYSKGLGSLSNYQIYYKTFNGAWSAETKVETSSDSDERPNLMQDRNGTLWLFWARKHFISQLAFYYFLEGQFSYNGGTTWSTQQQLTNTPTNVDSLMPFAVQSAYNKSIWLFYTTDANAADNIYALVSSPISPIQDVTIIGAYASVTLQYTGGLASIGQSPVDSLTITVLNLGDSSQVVTVSLTVYNTTSYVLAAKKNLAVPGGTANVVFNWNTTGVAPGWYSVQTNVAPVPGETVQDQTDNNYTSWHTLRILPLSDINQDGKINIIDASICYLGYASTPGRQYWEPRCDLDNKGLIDISHDSYVALHY